MGAKAVHRKARRYSSAEECISLRHFLLPTGWAGRVNASGHVELSCISYCGWLGNKADHGGNLLLQRPFITFERPVPDEG